MFFSLRERSYCLFVRTTFQTRLTTGSEVEDRKKEGKHDDSRTIVLPSASASGFLHDSYHPSIRQTRASYKTCLRKAGLLEVRFHDLWRCFLRGLDGDRSHRRDCSFVLYGAVQESGQRPRGGRILARKQVMTEAGTPATNAGSAPPALPAWLVGDPAHRVLVPPSRGFPARRARL